MSAKVAEMSRKKQSQPQEGTPPPKETDTIRVERELAHRISQIATRRKISVSDLVTPLLKPKIDELFRQIVREMNEEISG